MKRILLTSPDYGLAFGVDRALRELISAGALSAVGCLVVSDLWSREYLPLRDTVDSVRHRTLVGLTLTLTHPFAPLSMRARSQFARLLALGLTLNFFLYMFINIAMVTGLLPVVGIPLPLISYGGTAMLTLMIGFGFVIGAYVHRDVRISRRGVDED